MLHFLLFPQYFLPFPNIILISSSHFCFHLQRILISISKMLSFDKELADRLNHILCCLQLYFSYPFPNQALVFRCLQYKSFENTVGKGEIARHEQFLLFPQCFLPVFLQFSLQFEIVVCKVFEFGRL